MDDQSDAWSRSNLHFRGGEIEMEMCSSYGLFVEAQLTPGDLVAEPIINSALRSLMRQMQQWSYS